MKRLGKNNIVELLEKAKKGEVDTIKEYEYILDNTDNEEIMKLIKHIKEEEEEHRDELNEIINKLRTK